MTPASARTDEDRSIAALLALEVLDTPPEAEFDALVRVASAACGVPISLLSLIDRDRQWFKANLGLPGVSQTPRELAFCAHAVLGDELFEVPDATLDTRFKDNPLVHGAPDIRFYAGAPVTLSNGHRIGTLCVIDRQPRWLDAQQRQVLSELSVVAAQMLEGRAAQRRAERIAAELALSQTQLRQVVDNVKQAAADLEEAQQLGQIGSWIWHVQIDSAEISKQMALILGLAPGQPPPNHDGYLALYAPESAERLLAAIGRAQAGEPYCLELQLRGAPARPGTWVEARGAVVRDAAGSVIAMRGTLQDITERRRMAAELAEQHELLRVTLQSIGDAVITTDAQGTVTWLNPVAERMTGWPAGQAQGRPLAEVFQIVNEQTREPAQNPVATCLAQGHSVGLADHALLIARDGAECGIEDSAAPIRNAGGEVLGVVLVFRDVSEQRRMAGEMRHRATHDSLTGLVNRAEFESRLLHALRSAQETQAEHALLVIDLDQFKLVNDACGHAVGDELLKRVSQLLGEAIRSRDTLARLGGDEFAILLENCVSAQAHRVAQKICDRMDDFRFVHEDRRFRIGTSIGLVPVDKRWASTAAIQQAADAACYAAKEAGRNRVHAWFDTDAALQARHAEMQWTSRIERALGDDGFVLFAQRIQPLGIDRGKRSGPVGEHAEVLLRMKNADGSLALPGAFLPAAERFHLVTRIDRWVLGQAVAWLASLSAPELIEELSVNLSGQSVSDRAFHAWAQGLLAEAGPRVCSQLCLEITETAAITHLADAAIFIAAVRGAGVKVALDDFGAGASSFGYLKSLRVDTLKIDGRFIRDLATDPLDDAAVRSFVEVARVVGVKTVAEFVDKPAVLQRLREIGVDYAQGFLIHRPEPIAALVETATVGQT